MSEELSLAEQEWRERFRAVARAQRRYLWFLLLAGVFYIALDAQAAGAEQTTRQQIPLVGIEIDAQVVWASAPVVLGLVALAALGTFPALTYAHKSCARVNEESPPFERLDIHPTAIDFAVYVPPGAARWTRLGRVTYPLFVALIWLEAAWIWLKLLRTSLPIHGRLVFLNVGALLLVLCLWRLARLSASKIKTILEKAGLESS